MTEEENITELVDWFFSKINIPVIENAYIHKSRNWDALCASLTLLKDLQRPKNEYNKLNEINHLEAIGIMQTIYIEQDCMLTFQNAILEQSQKNHLIKYSNIRSLRNEAFGHPSERKKKDGLYSRHFFDILNDKSQILKIFDWKATGDIESYQFELSQKVKENSNITRDYLEETKIKFIEKMEGKIKSFKVNPSDLFNGANYIFEKLLTKHNDSLVIDNYNSIGADLEKFKEALIERKVFDDYKKDYEMLIFFSTKLEGLFYIQTYEDIEFYSYAVSLRRGISEVKKCLEEIDRLFD